jgi:hypothetical protein
LNALKWGAALGVLLPLFGCTTFPEIEANVCGNAVIEGGEDCDTFADAPSSCRPAGLVGECHFDCRLNADGSRAKCPAGSGCAPDGICRQPTGDFDAASKFSSDISSWLSTADFDGDARPDVISTEPADQLQQARFRIHYFDPDNELTETRIFPRVTTRPVPRKLNGDDAADLIFSNDLIGMLPGRADRDFVPATFSSYSLPGAGLRAVGVRDGGVGEAIGLAVFSELEEGRGVYVPSLANGKLSLRAPLSRPIETLAGQPISADLSRDHDSPCAEVIFAFMEDREFHTLDLCRVGHDVHGPEVDWREKAIEQVVRLPAGVRVNAAPTLGDVDGDGNLDVLIGGVVGDEAGTYVAHGDGLKLEDEATLLLIPILGQDEPFRIPMPLAAGDLTGDGVADFVLPLGLVASHTSLVDGKIGYFVSITNNAEPWSTAIIADLNANDLPDVIAGAVGAPGLSFLNGTGGPFQIAARITTQGPLRFLTTGDFDGDLIGDVAFLQSGPPKEATESLLIAFGKRDGVAPVGSRIAELKGVQQLGSTRQAGIDSLFTTSTERVDGELSSTFTLFDGNPDRLPFAPYSLVTFAKDGSLQDSRARALVVGAFTAPGANDVFAVGGLNGANDWNLWLVPDIGGGKKPPQLLAAEGLPVGAVPLTLEVEGGRLSVAGAAADLDGDGFDEAVLLMPQDVGADPVLHHCVLSSYDVDAAVGRATSHGSVSFDESCAQPELAAADLNADGAVDLLLSMGDPSVAPRVLKLLYNDGAGRFSPENSAAFQIEGHDLRGFSVFQVPPELAHSNTAARLAFVTDEGLYLVRGRELDDVKRLQRFDDARGVTVADPNGDDIEDVVVADAAGLWLVKAQLR